MMLKRGFHPVSFAMLQQLGLLAALVIAGRPLAADAVCGCLNNATVHDLDTNTGGDDGQFSERIVVNAPAMQTWTVTAQTGAYDADNVPPVGTKAPLVPIATDGSVTLTPIGAGTQYALDFVFVESVGYTMSVSNGTTTLSISNNCRYPNPTFAPPIADSYDIGAPPVTLGAVSESGPPLASTTFTIDSVAATQLVPASLARRPVIHTAGLTATGTDQGEFRACIQGAQKSFVVINSRPAPAMDVRWAGVLLAALLVVGVRILRRA
ncbi:MAG: hypothetical protein ABI624_10030 [Casimicrobiaceae bacterium]